jgi:hypothetical protein
MAAGDFYIRKNSGLTTAVPNAGSNLDSDWDSIHFNEGSIVTYSDPNFQLDTGIYLIMYSEYFDTTDTTNNERIEIQGEIHQSGVGAIGGRGQGFIRKSSGDQECVVRGSSIVEVTSDNTDFFIRFYRTDNSTSGTVSRVPGNGGVQVLELDDAQNYGLYSQGASQNTSGTTALTMNTNTNDRQDTGFSNSSGVITLTNAGRYLVIYEADLSQTATGREDIRGFLTINGTSTVEVGSYSFCYLRGSDGTQDGALSWVGIIDVAASDTVQVRVDCPTSATITVDDGKFQLWQIPSGGDELIAEATTGNYNTDADFSWDTNPHIDAGSFTHVVGQSTVDVDQDDHILSFATLSQQSVDTPQRAVPFLTFEKDGNTLDYICGDAYHRNSGGAGQIAITIAGIVTSVDSGSSINIHTLPKAASGTLTNESGSFSLLSLGSIWGPYTFPPSVSDFNTTDSFLWGNTNLVITGSRFGAIQGTGKVEFWDDASGTIKEIQSIDSWADTSIQIDTSRGSLPDDTTVFLVVTSDGGSESPTFPVSVGVPTYQSVIDSLDGGPDHHWSFNNTYEDVGVNGPNDCSVVAGAPTFTTNPITRGRTHAFTVSDQGQRIEPPNSNWMNGQTETTRTMGGWLRFTEVQESFVCVYEEGGGVNNLAFFIGMGGILIAQLADTSDDNVHAYSNFKLQPNRDYQIMFRFDYTGTDAFELLIDGVVQTTTFGNPLISAGGHLDAHSGDIGWGDAAGSLEVFGTDITFPACVTSYHNDWYTWTSFLSESNIRSELFVKGVVADITIQTDTETNMQSDIDLYTGTSRVDSACNFRIEGSSDGDFELSLDDITFSDSASIHIMYTGTDVLTVVNLNGSNASITETPYGGTVNIITPSTVTVTGLVSGSEVRIYEAGTTTEIGGIESSGTTFELSVQVSSIDISVLSLGYQNVRQKSIDTTSNTSVPISQRVDRQYENL